jgi:hypothetical protein
MFISTYYYFNIIVPYEFIPNPIDTVEVQDIQWFTPEETVLISKNKDVKVYFNRLLNSNKYISNILN